MTDSFSVNNVDPYTPKYTPGRQNPEQKSKKKKTAAPEQPQAGETDQAAESDNDEKDQVEAEKIVGTQVDLEA